MRDFSHLTATVSAQGFRRVAAQYAGAAAAYDPDDNSQTDNRHSNAHRIAVSREAINNPVLALKLIAQGKPSARAIKLLASTPRQLSNYTDRKMAHVCPGWECLDDEDRNTTAFTFSLNQNDANGYFSGVRAAQKALEKYIEPWTIEDIRAVQVS